MLFRSVTVAEVDEEVDVVLVLVVVVVVDGDVVDVLHADSATAPASRSPRSGRIMSGSTRAGRRQWRGADACR